MLRVALCARKSQLAGRRSTLLIIAARNAMTRCSVSFWTNNKWILSRLELSGLMDPHFVGRQRTENLMKRKMLDLKEEPDLQPRKELVKWMRRGPEERDVKPEKADTCEEAVPSITKEESERNRMAVPCEGPEEKAKKRTKDRETTVKNRGDFSNRYVLGHLLGKGGCGAVYAGVRKSDGKKVALKFIHKQGDDTYITLPGDTRRLPHEVALMELVCKPPQCPFVIELVEWHETPTNVILVLERPEPCIDLFDFCATEFVCEPVARTIMRQVIHAARHCSDRGVFHRDIKSENILLNPHTLHVKLIDFGCGDLLKTTPYTQYGGTKTFRPPEWIVKGEYEAEPATVWGLGVFLYQMLCGQELFCGAKDIVNGHVDFPANLSEASCSLIKMCLQRDPKKRPTLKQILSHQWFGVQEARERQWNRST